MLRPELGVIADAPVIASIHSAGCPVDQGGYLISVVIPAFNYAHFLPKCLDSVLGQLADDMELIVVDDGSTDVTAMLLAEYRQRYPRLRVLGQSNAGAAAARNLGIACSRGRFILPMDADDELLPGALRALRASLLSLPAVELVLAGRISRQIDGREHLHLPKVDLQAGARRLASQYLLHKQISLAHGSTLFRRDLLLRGPYPEGLAFGEDIPVFAGALACASIAILSLPVVRINKHPGSRRRARGTESLARALVDEVFARLPSECQSLRRRYTAQVYLSLFRTAWRDNGRPEAACFYARAVRLSPFQALRWRYLRKVLRLFVGLKSQDKK